MSKDRIHWIDIAKGIVIICVMLGHTISTPRSSVGAFIYFFHMPAFFMLSGVVFSNRRKFGEFIVNKLKTIVLPIFTLGLTGSVIVAILMKFIKHETIDWKKIFLAPVLQFSPVNGSRFNGYNLLWYLAALFIVMLVFYVVTKLTKDNIKMILPISFALGLASYCFIKFVGIAVPWSINTALVALPFTAIGYSMKKLGCSQKLSKPYIPIITFVICIVSGFINNNFFGDTEMHNNMYGNIFLFYIAAVSGSIMIISASMHIKKNSVLEYLGRNSLIFYALEIVQYFFNFVLGIFNFDGTDSGKFVMNMVVSIIAVTAMSVCYCLIAWLINHILPFLIGKSYKEVKS